MTAIPQTVGTAAGVFAVTNVDGLVILLGLHVSRRNGAGPSARQIVIGQYLGFAALIGLAATFACGLTNVPPRWLCLLGLMPITIGLRGLWLLRVLRPIPAVDRPRATTLASTCLTTVASGFDNISVYALLFRQLELQAVLITVGVFTLMLALWYAASALLVRLVGHLLPQRILAGVIPVLLVVVGAVILSRAWLTWCPSNLR